MEDGIDCRPADTNPSTEQQTEVETEGSMRYDGAISDTVTL